MINIAQQFQKIGIKTQINEVIAPYQNIGGLYISNYAAAVNYQLIKKHNIKATITALKGCYMPYTKQQMPNYLYVPIDDKPTANISQYFQKCSQFIDRSRNKTNVLIHCRAGVSRSSTIVLAYLMKKFDYSLKESYLLLKRSHPRAKPNSGFMEMLQKYGKQLNPATKPIENPLCSSNEPVKVQKQVLSSNTISLPKQSTIQNMAKQLRDRNAAIYGRINHIKDLVSSRLAQSRCKSEYLLKKLDQARAKSQSIKKLQVQMSVSVMPHKKQNNIIDMSSHKVCQSKAITNLKSKLAHKTAIKL